MPGCWKWNKGKGGVRGHGTLWDDELRPAIQRGERTACFTDHLLDALVDIASRGPFAAGNHAADHLEWGSPGEY